MIKRCPISVYIYMRENICHPQVSFITMVYSFMCGRQQLNEEVKTSIKLSLNRYVSWVGTFHYLKPTHTYLTNFDNLLR